MRVVYYRIGRLAQRLQLLTSKVSYSHLLKVASRMDVIRRLEGTLAWKRPYGNEGMCKTSW